MHRYHRRHEYEATLLRCLFFYAITRGTQMNKTDKTRGWLYIALVAVLFLGTSSTCFARSFLFFNGGSNVPYGGGYYVPNGYYGTDGSYGRTYYQPPSSPNYREYRAALTHPSLPDISGSTASDYLSSVCAEGAYTWDPNKMPIKVWIADGTGTPGYKPIFQSYIRNGFNAWTAVSGNKLSWREVSDPADADITVRWTNKVTERPEGTEAGRTSALTRLNTATNKGIIYGARMQFLTMLPTRSFTDEEVEKTCLHEAGHAMGLQGHSPYRGDIMYYAIGPSQQAKLSDRDVNTLTKLYADHPSLDQLALEHKTPTAAAHEIAR